MREASQSNLALNRELRRLLPQTDSNDESKNFLQPGFRSSTPQFLGNYEREITESSSTKVPNDSRRAPAIEKTMPKLDNIFKIPANEQFKLNPFINNSQKVRPVGSNQNSSFTSIKQFKSSQTPAVSMNQGK